MIDKDKKEQSQSRVFELSTAAVGFECGGWNRDFDYKKERT